MPAISPCFLCHFWGPSRHCSRAGPQTLEPGERGGGRGIWVFPFVLIY